MIPPATVQPEVSVLVVGYRSLKDIEGCLRTLYAHIADVSFETLFLDNSCDGSAAYVSQHHPAVRIVENDRNLGFGPGNNVLARHAKGEYLLLLNPDTVIHDNAVKGLLDFARSRPDGGAWGGVTMLPDGRVDPGCMQSGPSLLSVLGHCFGLGKFLHGGMSKSLPAVAEVRTLTGAFMMVRSDVWRELGGFDESFFLYNEEADLCQRISMTGRKILMTPMVRITHLVGSGTGQSSSRMLAQMKGRMQFVRKHYSAPLATLHGLIGWLHAANRVAGSLLALPLLGRTRAKRIRETWLPLAARPSTWWRGWSSPDGGRDYSPKLGAAALARKAVN